MPPPPLPLPPHPTFLYYLGDLALYTSLVPLLLFAGFYLFRSNWRATAPGRAIAYLVSTLVVVLVLGAITRFAGQDWNGREWVRAIVYIATNVAMWRLFASLLKIQRREHKEETSPNESYWDAHQRGSEGGGSR